MTSVSVMNCYLCICGVVFSTAATKSGQTIITISRLEYYLSNSPGIIVFVNQSGGLLIMVYTFKNFFTIVVYVESA